MASSGASWARFGPSWRAPVPLAYLGDLVLGASWRFLWGLLESSWAPLGPVFGCIDETLMH